MALPGLIWCLVSPGAWGTDGRESVEWSRNLTVNLPFLPFPPPSFVAAGEEAGGVEADGVVAEAVEDCWAVFIPDNKSNMLT